MLTGCADPDAETGSLAAESVSAAPSPTDRPLSWGLGRGPAPSEPVTPAPESAAAESEPEPAPAPPPAEPAPPAPPPRHEGECIASRDGEPASQSAVATALAEAAGRTYWPVSAPEISVPAELVRAIAWQESGWQSDIIACDGGIGVMQVMPDTADFVNQRFEVSHDPHTLEGNTTLGVNYLAWLIKYFGDVHFEGSYRLAGADCADHLDPCLLNAVIAGYNFGPAAVESGDGLAVPNPRYVENVRALLTDCPCHGS
ncbi:lytic transglycosylase domain-containing protein [Natronosporangium hydrolyticum]|uniref:Lytic transglycosylase domain-containing protein n=2 Tax=Natronosporangium hydrolyticum TaxID=2811111 RepID=A0A895YRC5_9ACTN|nr:lytic transglycosylase domain-containing protein [Natronosporangium hydrolyticum]